MILSEQTAINIYFDFMAFFMITGLLAISRWIRTKTPEARFFRLMCISVISEAFFCILSDLSSDAAAA